MTKDGRERGGGKIALRQKCMMGRFYWQEHHEQNPVPQNMTLFRNRIYVVDTVKMQSLKQTQI